MQISAIQGHISKASTGMQQNKQQNSISSTKNSTSDSFSKEKQNEISFKGFKGAVAGGMGMLAGGLALVLTGGLASIPAG